MADLTIKRNDLLPILTLVARDHIGPADLDGATALVRVVNVLNGSTKVDETADVTPNLPFAASGATLTSNAHGLNDDESVTLTTSGSLPGGLSALKEYFVINATANMLQLSLVKGGAAITTTSAGTGTHNLITGRVGYDWQDGDTDTAGTYFAEIQTTANGKQLTYPNGSHFLIEVVSDLA